MTGDAVEHYLSEYSRLEKTQPAWLQSQRRAAIDVLRDRGFPTTRNEAWKYTDLRDFLKQRFVVSGAPDHAADAQSLEALRFSGLECHELVFINGHYSAALSSTGKLAEGVELTALSAGDKALRAELETLFNTGSSVEKHGFAALNTAFVVDGTYLHVPANLELQQPVHLIFFSDDESASISHPHNLIRLGENARATVIESYGGVNGQDYCTNTVSEIITAAGAHLEHYKVQQEGDSAFHIGYLHARCDRDSRLESHSISIGGQLVRNDIDTELHGQGAHVDLNGLYIGHDRQHIDNHTRVDHQVPDTSSDETYRGILNDKSRAVFNGKVVVHKDAQRTDANQSNSNLLLSNDAEIDTKPELEIYADDVKCSHGATVGQLDDNMLFYLRSRAVDESTARSLLTFAFADEVIKRIKFAPVRERLEYTVAGRLPEASLIKEFLK